MIRQMCSVWPHNLVFCFAVQLGAETRREMLRGEPCGLYSSPAHHWLRGNHCDLPSPFL